MNQITLNSETQLCISLSSRAGDLGMSLHNAAYRALGLNFVYKSFGVNDLRGCLSGVKALGIRGCSVSMPFKEAVIPFLDDLDPISSHIGAVNTIVNNSGLLTGYNTDFEGAIKALAVVSACPSDSVLLLGAGGVARAILYALKQYGFAQVKVSARNLDQVVRLNEILPCIAVPWEVRHTESVGLLINATPLGMQPNEFMLPIHSSALSKVHTVMDVIISPFESALVSLARKQGIRVAPGYVLALEQMKAQFKLYTGISAPEKVIDESFAALIQQ